MASQKQFEAIPPFPDDLPTIDFKSIPLSGLMSGDPKAARDLFEASKVLGFFLLDLNGDALGEEIIAEIDTMFDLSKANFNQPEEVKAGFPIVPGKNPLGFKPPGMIVTETGQMDRFEQYCLGQDGLFGVKDLQPLPPVLSENVQLIKSWAKHNHDIVLAICRALATELGIPVNTFADLHDPSKPCGTVMRLLRTEASLTPEDQRTAMIHHTDTGTITLLANVIGGLQILPGGDPKDNGAWRWFKPQPGKLLVNLGDIFVSWTGGILRSNVHRIRYAPGQQSHLDRYSLTFSARPMADATMHRIGDLGQESDLNSDMTATEFEWYKMRLLKQGKWPMITLGGKILSA